MTCNRFRTLVQQRFDQDLTTQDHRALINHLEGCESCAKFDHQLDQMIQAAQDTPAPDEVRAQNPEALARLIMEQLPQKKSSIVNMLMGMFSGGGSKAPKAKANKQKIQDDTRGGSAIKEKLKAKGKGKDNYTDKEPDMRPGGVSFGRKKDDQIDAAAIESQVGTFSRLKSISSNRAPEHLDREAQSTTRSLGEKFGMPGSNTILDEGPLTLAESIKRKVSESQKLSPLDDNDGDNSGSLVPLGENSGFGRPDTSGGAAAGGDGSSWGPPSFAAKANNNNASMSGMAPAAAEAAYDGGNWAGGAAAPGRTGNGAAPNFAAPTPIGFDEHPGSSIGLAPPGGRRPDMGEGKAGIGISVSPNQNSNPNASMTGLAQSPVGLAGGGNGGAGNSGGGNSGGGNSGGGNSGGSGWGATDTSRSGASDPGANWGGASAPPARTDSGAVSNGSPAAPAANPGWTSGWGGEGQAAAPLKSSDSWAVPGSDSTNSWGQPGDSINGGVNEAAPAAAPAALAQPAQDAWSAPSGAWGGGQAAADAANAQPNNATAGNAQPAQSDAWGAAASTSNSSDPWGSPAAPAAAPIQPSAANTGHQMQPAVETDVWGSPSAAAAAPASSSGHQMAAASPAEAAPIDAWGAPAASTGTTGSAWGGEAAQSSANSAAPSDAWGSPASGAADPPITASGDNWGVVPAPANSAGDAWGNAAASNIPEPATASSSSDAWNAAATPVAQDNAPITGLMATGYVTIPPGQFATPANAGTAIASSGWGQAPVPPAALDAAQIEAKKNAWSAEAEQLETGTWRAFAPKMNQDLGAKATPPAPPTPSGDRWDVPIQERAKTMADQSIPNMPAALPPALPMPAPAAAVGENSGRWDVPIQERPKEEAPINPIGQPQAAPQTIGGANFGMPPGAAAGSGAVLSSGIPVNQIVEKMGQVLGGQSAAASSGEQESRWDVPIQERKNGQNSQEIQPVQPAAAVNAFNQQAPQAPAASGWGQSAPVAQAAPAVENNSWGAPAASAPAVDNGAWGAPAANGWGQEAPAAAAPAWDNATAAVTPASSPNNGWGSGDGVQAPPAQPTSTWGQPAGSGWGDPPAMQNNQPAQAGSSPAPAPAASGWGTPPEVPAANAGWNQPAAAPASNGWGAAAPQAPAAPPAPPMPPQPVKAEVTDKVQGGGLLSGIDDRAIDRIFGEIGVQESVSKTLVNSGAEPVSNFSPPAQAGQFMEAQNAAPVAAPAPAPTFAQAAPVEAPMAKGLLGGIDDNAIDRIFSQNLGVSEASMPVGRSAEMTAPAMAAGNAGWGNPPAPAAAAPPAPAVDVSQSGGWGAALPPASSGWGMPPAPMPEAPPEPAPTANTGWGAPPSAPGQWGMAPATGANPSNQGSAQFAAPPPAPALPMPAQAFGEGGSNKLFSVDDSVMDRIFSENLGIPQDSQPAANAGNVGYAAPPAAPVHPTLPEMPQPAMPFQSGPPPKIAGIGRLDSNADPNQDAGSGRIASIGKFLLDQKDLDKIGKLTNTDSNNDGKLRILTKENSDDLQALLGQIGAQVGVIGSVIVGHDGLLIANTMPPDMDAESVGVWALGVYMNTEHVTKKMGHDRVHQVVSRTPRGYVIIADFGGGLLVCVTEGTNTDSLIPLMRTITQLVN